MTLPEQSMTQTWRLCVSPETRLAVTFRGEQWFFSLHERRTLRLTRPDGSEVVTLLTQAEAEERFGVTVIELREIASRGHIEALRIGPVTYVVTQDDDPVGALKLSLAVAGTYSNDIANPATTGAYEPPTVTDLVTPENVWQPDADPVDAEHADPVAEEEEVVEPAPFVVLEGSEEAIEWTPPAPVTFEALPVSPAEEAPEPPIDPVVEDEEAPVAAPVADESAVPEPQEPWVAPPVVDDYPEPEPEPEPWVAPPVEAAEIIAPPPPPPIPVPAEPVRSYNDLPAPPLPPPPPAPPAE